MIQPIFEKNLRKAFHVWGPKNIDLMVDYSDDAFPNNRDYAYCSSLSDNYCVIVVAPKMQLASDDRIEAVLRHEIGHAIDFLVPEEAIDAKLLERGLTPIHTPERKADQIAEFTFGDKIYYDDETVQSLFRGEWPRPIHLGL
jgi:hypothetical protein